MPRRYRRAISTIVGLALFVVLAAVVLSVLYAVAQSLASETQRAAEILRQMATASAQHASITGFWSETPLGLVIALNNTGGLSASIPAIVVVLSNGSFLALYPGKTLGSAVVESASGATIYSGPLRLPLNLPPGGRARIVIPVPNAVAVSIASGASPSTAVAALGIQRESPTKVVSWKRVLLPYLYMPGTVVWGGLGRTIALKNVSGVPYPRLIVGSGTVSPTAIELIDGVASTVTSTRVPPSVNLVQRAALTYLTFDSASGYVNATLNSYSSWVLTSRGFFGGGLNLSSDVQINEFVILSPTPIDVVNGSGGVAYVNSVAYPQWRYIYADILYPGNTTAVTSSTVSWGTVYLLYIHGVALVQNNTNYIVAGPMIVCVYSSSETSCSPYYGIVESYYNATANAIYLRVLNYTQATYNVKESEWVGVGVKLFNSSAGIAFFYNTTTGLPIANLTFVSNEVEIEYPGVGGYVVMHAVSSSITLLGSTYYFLVADVEFNGSATFDELVAGPNNVTSITVTGLEPGYVVYYTTNVSSVSIKASGTSVNISVVPAPIATGNITVVPTNPANSASYVGLVVGGDVYQYLPPRYEVELSVASYINTSGSLGLYRLFAVLSSSSNISITGTLYVNVSGRLVPIYSFSSTPIQRAVVSLPLSYLNASSYINLVLFAWNESPFTLSIDALNGNATLEVPSPLESLVVAGRGNTTLIDIYESSPGSLTYVTTINASPIVFNGSVELVVFNDSAYIATPAGVYAQKLFPGSTPQLLTTACSGGPGAEVTMLNVSNTPVMVIAKGSSYCVLNASSGQVIATGTLPTSLRTPSLGAASSIGTEAFFTLYNASGSYLASYVYGSGWRVIARLGPINFVGLAASSTSVSALAAGGPLYIVSPASGSVSTLTTPWYPLELPGARVCYVSGQLIVFRLESSEAWILS